MSVIPYYYEQSPFSSPDLGGDVNNSGSVPGIAPQPINMTGSTDKYWFRGQTEPTGSTTGSTNNIKSYTSAIPGVSTFSDRTGRSFRRDSTNELSQLGEGYSKDTVYPQK